MLKGKHILVGISGGIAAYKIPELIRLLKKEEAEVCVCTTRNALQFVTPLTLETLSNNQVYSDVFAPHNNHQTEHISLPDWADLMIIAPCTANVIGKMAAGIADDALTTTFLAMTKPVLVAPAMNDKMLVHPAVQSFGRVWGSLKNFCSTKSTLSAIWRKADISERVELHFPLRHHGSRIALSFQEKCDKRSKDFSRAWFHSCRCLRS